MLRRRSATASASAAVPLACFPGGRIGSRAIKRVAIARESGSVKGWSGSARINESNLRTAASAGIAARLAASSQGSRSRRASSDTTLSSMPFRPSPIGENRKALNSEPRRGARAAAFTSFARSSWREESVILHPAGLTIGCRDRQGGQRVPGDKHHFFSAVAVESRTRNVKHRRPGTDCQYGGAPFGVLRVRDIPGSGCVFSIDLPRHPLP